MSSFKTKQISKNPHQNPIQISKIPAQKTRFSAKNHTENFAEKKEIVLTSSEKNRRRARKISGIFLIISVLVFGAVFAIKAIGNTPLGKNNDLFNPIISLIEDNNKPDTKTPEKRGSQNILIAGIGGLGHPGGELTDSLMLANLNYDTKTVTLLSIPRDIYVAYSSNTAGKINALYPIGRGQNE